MGEASTFCVQRVGVLVPGVAPEAQDHKHHHPQQQEGSQRSKEDPEEGAKLHAQVLTAFSPGRVDGEGHTAATGPLGQVLALASVLTVALTARGHTGQATVGAVDQVVTLVAIAFEVSLQHAHVQSLHTVHIFPGDGMEVHIGPGPLTSVPSPP